ncbi:DUF5129 domain-containing protein [Corynebacterium pseudotuberculosis]|uniref:DUF5129 domain-containing protein n=1 Tax=Corynebacterium pseudotuberculosis TaxID=1719 RepID=UPI00030901CC|nr:DUF5129 domain-containing protein [Corynebacterium pseudotuberculosis]AFM08250.2 DUF5129 domain-containing protein [Corynebacterium pseudotuberculosis Cp162]APG82659.1 Hypothetical protein CPI37_2045 [Corynebacterium pseudotuberculosis]WFP67069.1 DUF5129 domain-containing protein [Corynebacterium pseudotuberculosis]
MRNFVKFSCLITAVVFSLLLFPPGALTIARADAPVNVTIYDQDNVLSPGEEAELTQKTQALNFPAHVPNIDYIISATATTPYDDWVKDFGLHQHRELINQEGNKWADGHVLFTVDVNLRTMGTYVGEDLKGPLGYNQHSTRYSDSMKKSFKNGDWVGGLLTGTTTVADYDPNATNNSNWIVGGIFAAGGAAFAAIVGFISFHYRKQRRQLAMQNYQTVATNYTHLANNLDSIDIRAHSLSSPIADATLRREWEDIKNGFLAQHETMMQLPENADEKAIYARRKELAAAAASVTQLRNAENNIDTLFRMEKGNTDVRLAELTALHEDILKAEVEADDAAIQARIGELSTRCRALIADPAAANFMDEYALIVSEYGTVTKALAQKQFSQADLENNHTPSLGASDWHPGYGNYVPFFLMTSWHNDAVSAAEASSTSSTASYSGGFSGAGSSGSF